MLNELVRMLRSDSVGRKKFVRKILQGVGNDGSSAAKDRGGKHMPVVRVWQDHACLQPFVAAVLAVILLSEPLSWLQVVGGILIGVGILFVRRRAPAPQAT